MHIHERTDSQQPAHPPRETMGPLTFRGQTSQFRVFGDSIMNWAVQTESSLNPKILFMTIEITKHPVRFHRGKRASAFLPTV